jgi:hypothetical protein
MGRLIPAGTGLQKYNRMEAVTDEPTEPEAPAAGAVEAGEAVA